MLKNDPINESKEGYLSSEQENCSIKLASQETHGEALGAVQWTDTKIKLHFVAALWRRFSTKKSKFFRPRCPTFDKRVLRRFKNELLDRGQSLVKTEENLRCGQSDPVRIPTGRTSPCKNPLSGSNQEHETRSRREANETECRRGEFVAQTSHEAR